MKRFFNPIVNFHSDLDADANIGILNLLKIEAFFMRKMSRK